jgi:hypothetical protein
MLRYMGIGGILGFMQALVSIGETGKQLSDTFVRFVNGGNGAGLASLMSEDCRIFFVDEEVTTDELVNKGLSVATGKILAAGNVVSASCRVATPTAELKGVVFFEFNMKTKKICAVNFCLE